jgi:hypothetical protein
MGQHVMLSSSIELCVPPLVCAADTCPPTIGTCVGGKCVYKDSSFKGLATLAEGRATQYCDLKAGACDGALKGLPTPAAYQMAQSVATKLGFPVCADSPAATGTCIGIVATPPLMFGNSQIAIDPSTGTNVALWGAGATAASGLCYQITGTGGTAVVAVTDRCGGFCMCATAPGGTPILNECGSCLAYKTEPDFICPCVGSAPPAFSAACTDPTQHCDWCASSNHPHFDLDDATFAHVCQNVTLGSCKISSVSLVPCVTAAASWPPK